LINIIFYTNYKDESSQFGNLKFTTTHIIQYDQFNTTDEEDNVVLMYIRDGFVYSKFVFTTKLKNTFYCHEKESILIYDFILEQSILKLIAINFFYELRIR